MTALLTYLCICIGCLPIVWLLIQHAPVIEDYWIMDISHEQLDQLHTIRLRALSRQERVEAITDEAEADCNKACEILGVGDNDAAGRGYCDDLAFHGAHVIPTVEKIAKSRAVG